MCELGELPAEIRSEILAAALAPAVYYCTAERKRVYIDKSLDSVPHLAEVEAVLPETRYVLLVRHVMDTVMSGIEASQWGFHAYGYASHVHPTNFVAGLVAHWQAHTAAVLEWEKSHSERCLWVRYEDLVGEPERILTEVFEFLGVRVDLSVLDRALGQRASASGPGDYKVRDTRDISDASLGRGRRVPVRLIPAPLLAATNEALVALGYTELSEEWNIEARELLRGPITTQAHADLEVLMKDLDIPLSPEVGQWSVAVEDRPDLRWLIDGPAGEVRQSEQAVDQKMIATADDLIALIRGGANVGAMIVAGRLRCDFEASRRGLGDVAEVVQALREGFAKKGLRPISES